MEDRHYLSEPRPVPGLDLPTWEVDVLREGVDVPILTLRLDRITLPPRKSKKKVVWRLPDTVDMIPKFGAQDKTRILEIFKDKKKELKKSKRRASQEPSLPVASGDEESVAASSSIETTSSDVLCQGSFSSKPQVNPRSSSDDSKETPSSATSVPSAPPGLESLTLNTPVLAASNHLRNGMQNGNSAVHPSIPHPPPPPGIHTEPLPRPAPPLPPPGMSVHQSSMASRDVPSQSTSHQAQVEHRNERQQGQQYELAQNEHHGPLPTTWPLNPAFSYPSSLHPTIPTLPSTGRCFLLPPATESSSQMMALANLVTEAYYLMLHRGLITELGSYYAIDSQKSLTVGGAYAACSTADERIMQLQSLAGTIKPHIKGIQQQPTWAGGVMVLITGISGRPPAGLMLPFCHSLVLSPVSVISDSTSPTFQVGQQRRTTIGYQIQNDNLVFLTGDD
jgi:hypothetical protein